jgi:hypothetical protein
MTDYKTRLVVNTYFNILQEEGLPEEYVYDFKCEDDCVKITLLSGKVYSKKLKRVIDVEAARDV